MSYCFFRMKLIFPNADFSMTMKNLLVYTLYNWLNTNPLPDDKILHFSKMKAFADSKLNIVQNIQLVLHRIENIVGKGENAGNQHFLLFPQCFLKVFASGVSKVVTEW